MDKNIEDIRGNVRQKLVKASIEIFTNVIVLENNKLVSGFYMSDDWFLIHFVLGEAKKLEVDIGFYHEFKHEVTLDKRSLVNIFDFPEIKILKLEKRNIVEMSELDDLMKDIFTNPEYQKGLDEDVDESML